MNTHLIVAKYIPNVRRMEPRNIGLIGWCDGSFESKFLGCDDASIPKFLNDDKYAFSEWKDIWEHHMAQKIILDESAGEYIAVDDVRFIDVLMRKSKLQFCLTRSATVMAPKKELSLVVDEMFQALVTKPSKESPSASSELKNRFMDLFKDSRLNNNVHAKDRVHKGKFHGVEKPFTFDFAFGAKKTAIFHRVSPGHGTSANLAAFMFNSVKEMNPDIECCTVYNGEGITDEGKRDIELVSSVSSLVDVAKKDEAILEIKKATGVCF